MVGAVYIYTYLCLFNNAGMLNRKGKNGQYNCTCKLVVPQPWTVTVPPVIAAPAKK
jgi:hypothetical protein